MENDRKKVLCFIGNHNRNENSLRWLKLLCSKGFDAWIMDSGSDNPPVSDIGRVIKYDNIFTGGMYARSIGYVKLMKPEYLMHIDDDILIDDENFEKLVERLDSIVKNKEIGIYQPSTSSKKECHNIFVNNVNAGSNDLRLTNSIEEWFYLIKSDIVLETDKYGINYSEDGKYGWGMGYLFCNACSDLGYPIVVDDYVVVEHPISVAGYDIKIASERCNTMLQKFNKTSEEIEKNCRKKNRKFNIKKLRDDLKL